jgi:hypothetical protein
MFSTSGIGLSATERWKDKVIFCQPGRLLANQSESQPQVIMLYYFSSRLFIRIAGNRHNECRQVAPTSLDAKIHH